MSEPNPLADRVAQRRPALAAQVLERQQAPEGARWLAGVSAAGAAAVLGCLLPAEAARRVAHMEPAAAGAAVMQMAPVRAAMFLRLLDEPSVAQILQQLPDASAGPLQYLLRYPDSVVGGWMEAGGFLLPREADVAEALERARGSERELERLLFVVDREQLLCGYVPAAALLREAPERPLAALLKRVPFVLRTRTGLATARNHPGWQTFDSLPVVNRENRVVGLLHRADLGQALSQADAPQSAAGHSSAIGELLEVSWHGLADMLDGGLRPDLFPADAVDDRSDARRH